MTLRKKLALLALAGMTVLSAVAVACSDDDDDEEDGDTTPAATAATTPGGGGDIDISGVAELDDGMLNIGSDIAYAPIEFLDETTNEPVGLDIDLANAIGELLGVEVTFENAAFDGLLPALDSERYDIIMSGMTANDERRQQVDFVEYFTAGSGMIVPTGNPDAIGSIEDLCGRDVAVQEGTIQVEYLETQSTACTDASGETINILKFPSTRRPCRPCSRARLPWRWPTTQSPHTRRCRTRVRSKSCRATSSTQATTASPFARAALP